MPPRSTLSFPPAPRRKPYAAPTLQEFGSVGQLTQAGTGAIMEGMNPQGMCVGGPNRTRC